MTNETIQYYEETLSHGEFIEFLTDNYNKGVITLSQVKEFVNEQYIY